MEKLGLNQIRQMFRDFYVSKGHYAAGSASLIPKNDKSLLIINSGMAPLKPYFAGVETPPSKRMTTCQKCIRTGDIDNVGITSRHGTFFEMLGNFSFGDYFKEESLHWGWEFITEHLKMPVDRIWATVYQDDDQAVEIWKKIGVPEERIVRLGKEDNFWEIGLGPCGPCSEIYFDRGEEYGCGKPDCKPGCDCDRYLEFWNHVFTQFSKEEDGSYSDLEHPNIDTGMGLERMACIMQGVDSIFDVDTIRHILNGVVEKSGVKYEDGAAKTDVSIRIITDHLRSMVFMIADGIIPSNEGRGYVLRRLIRRAARHGKILGIEGKFLVELSNRVIEVSGEAYPELVEKKDYIQKIISVEEEKFASTIDQGTSIILEYVEELKKENKTVLEGEKVFKLYDTFGFPLELTEEILAEAGCTADVDGFNANMKKQKEMARAGRKSTEEEAWKEAEAAVNVPETVFTGYTETEDEAKVLAIYIDGKEAQTAETYQNAVVYLDKTPFYAEGGGQASDNGIMSTDKCCAKVTAVEKSQGIFAHKVLIEGGSLSKGDTVSCGVNVFKRNATARNHTATHLLQKALRDVVGAHVEQAGSSVNENALRFDFTHFEGVTPEQLAQVELLVNERITEFLPVTTVETSMKEAQEMGAMALFGEKYGDKVRVVNCGDFSIELCGGTHVANTGQIGVFKIVSETGVASGVRRIEAVTGTGVLLKAMEAEETVKQIAENLKSNPAAVVQKSASIVEELKDTKKELEDFKKAAMGSEVDDMVKEAKEIGGIKLVTKEFKDYNINDLRNLSDDIKAQHKGIVMVFATVNGPKVTFLVSITDDLLAKGLHAGNMIKQIAAACGGGGGGKADMAQAGAKDPTKISAAFKVAEELLS
ncbi:alanine--tRNA ligase [Anaerotruncus sp. 80]|uniref:Alanine--tRNA ligase n=1 Tax=Anaerotruncus colihominis TaxID=169435 RepID=A0A845QI42_9FIRM|nr:MULTISPECIES: alanine--tRNA ligase [Anaerotruncus]NBH61124.1 alanine--tRNA ligase [Anaerotruncus colihominis]NCF01779.1 alanine--tRNA ligase [Anaerotruncus sp. 80]